MAMTNIYERLNEPKDFLINTFKKWSENELVAEINEKYLSKVMDNGRKMAEERYQKVKPMVQEMLDKRADFQQDARKVVEKWVETGKKYVEEHPVAADLEKKLLDGFEKARTRVTKPSKADIERLNQLMTTVKTRVEEFAAKRMQAVKNASASGKKNNILFRKF